MDTKFVLNWISNKKVEIWQAMQDNVADDDKWNRFRGAYDMLEELQLRISRMTNPHNREDIKRVNEKNELA